MNYKFSNNEKVFFSIEENEQKFSGIGYVVGVSLGTPSYGNIFLVKVSLAYPPVNTKEYPYDVIPIFEHFISTYDCGEE